VYGDGASVEFNDLVIEGDAPPTPTPTPTITPTPTPTPGPVGDIQYVDIATDSAFLVATKDFMWVSYVFYVLVIFTTGMALGFSFLKK